MPYLRLPQTSLGENFTRQKLVADPVVEGGVQFATAMDFLHSFHISHFFISVYNFVCALSINSHQHNILFVPLQPASDEFVCDSISENLPLNVLFVPLWSYLRDHLGGTSPDGFLCGQVYCVV